jgi:hypothetical protein
MPNLAPTTFSAGANDTLLTVDVYKKSSAGILTGVKDILSGNLSSSSVAALVNTPVAGVLLKSANASLVKAGIGKLQLNKDILTKSLIQSNPALVGAIKSLSAQTQANLTNMAGMVNKVQTTLGGITSHIASADLSTVANLGKMVTDLVGDTTLAFAYKDISAITSLSSNLVKEAASVGMTGLYSTLAGAEAITAPMLADITKDITPTMLELSDNKLLVEVSNTPGAKHLRDQSSNFISSYLTDYKLQQASIKDADRSEEFTEISEAFGRIDPDWMSTERNGEDVLDATNLSNASEPARQAMQAHVDAYAPNVAALADIASADDAFDRMNTAQHAPPSAYLLPALKQPTNNVKKALQQEIEYADFSD